MWTPSSRCIDQCPRCRKGLPAGPAASGPMAGAAVRVFICGRLSSGGIFDQSPQRAAATARTGAYEAHAGQAPMFLYREPIADGRKLMSGPQAGGRSAFLSIAKNYDSMVSVSRASDSCLFRPRITSGSAFEETRYGQKHRSCAKSCGPRLVKRLGRMVFLETNLLTKR